MNLKVWSEVKSGVNIAHLETSVYTPEEVARATEFGPLVVDLGGTYSGSITGGTAPVEVSYVLEPLRLTIDPSGGSVVYDRTFPQSAQYPVPGAAAKCYVLQVADKISAAYAAWKALSDMYVTTVNQTLI